MELREPVILIVEDEALIALDLAAMLEDEGGVRVEVAGTVAEALAAIERARPQAATLDFNLGAEHSGAVARRLHALGVPFVVLSGNPERARAALRGLPREVLDKPALPEVFLRALRACRTGRPLVRPTA
jgi:CheY-like chemotaxis protein